VSDNPLIVEGRILPSRINLSRIFPFVREKAGRKEKAVPSGATW